jgi:NDP-sugar pyrophosphorylase family protein
MGSRKIQAETVMHIIIPMSGLGSRFVRAGYKDPKPLIEIDGKPIIEHVCDLFPGEDKITFICRKEHLENTNMREILMRIRPTATIVECEPHKLGPVYAVSLMFDLIDDDEEVIVNYCDFGTYWHYKDFLNHTRARSAEGAVPAYKHFHPHMLGSTNYAFMRDDQQWMLEIQEKKPFTDNRMNEYASNGTYYFKHGRHVKKYFQQLMDLKQDLNGEYYVSMVYNLLRQDNLPVSIYEIEHMLQWGTPEDVQEYNAWSRYFRGLVTRPKQDLPAGAHINLIPMAGLGSRFKKEGYTTPKPLIPVSGKPMVVQAANALPPSEDIRFICLTEHLSAYPLAESIKAYLPSAQMLALDKLTEGQAITCLAGLEGIDESASLFIAACDNSMVYDQQKLAELIASDVDAIAFTFKNHISVKNNPQMYGYVKTDANDNAVDVSVKVPLSDTPVKDHAIVGAFYFKSVALFKQAVQSLVSANHRVNNEFYVDSLIGELVEMGYRVKPFLVDDYICWGTPNDLKTFEYWQSFFHKVDWHPYSLIKDPMMNPAAVAELDNTYRTFRQEFE